MGRAGRPNKSPSVSRIPVVMATVARAGGVWGYLGMGPLNFLRLVEEIGDSETGRGIPTGKEALARGLFF